jgi:hypothetical protein
MGYQTDFMGEIYLDPPLTQPQIAYLNAFNGTRRVQRDPLIAASFDDPIRHAVGLDIGLDGCFYVGAAEDGQHGQGNDASITDHNHPPGGGLTGYFDKAGREYGYGEDKPEGVEWGPNPNRPTMGEGAQPQLWCQWVPNESGQWISWDQGEKFYGYIEWMAYIVHHFLVPWGIKASGEITWVGEDTSDQGAIVIRNNTIRVAEMVVSKSEYQEVYAPA